MGRTGRITPFAVMEPVFVSGSTVSKATHSYLNVQQLGGHLLRRVFISDGPVLELRDDSVYEWVFPENCPSCG